MSGELERREHLSDEDLLAWIDREAGDGARQRIEVHLDQCAQCRDRAAVFAETTSEFAAYRGEVLSRQAPRIQMPEFEPGSRARLRRLLEAVALPRSYWRFAAAAAVVAFFVILSHRQTGPSVSGSELLSRAMAAEMDAGRLVARPVYYQKLALRSRGDSSTVETWSLRDDFRLAHRGGGSVWTDLERVYQGNRMGKFRPLSPAGFQSWSGSLETKTETVSLAELAGGAEALKITTRAGAAVAAGRLVEASLVVRSADWHPIRQTLRVQGEGEIQEFELMETAFQVMPASSLEPEILSLLRVALPAPPPLPPETTIIEQPAPLPDQDRTEMEALFALHRAHVCTGEPIEIRHAGSSLTVRGVVDSADRKLEVVQALRGIPGVHLDIQSAEEHLRQTAPLPPGATVPTTTPPAAAPVDNWQPALPPELADTANRAVSLADDALLEAWALRRLAEAFPRERTERLAPELRGMLETMVRDHAAALRRNVIETRALLANLAPVPNEIAREDAASDWLTEVAGLFRAVERERESVRDLFTNLRGTDRERSAARFAESNAAAERLAMLLDRNAALAFPSGMEQNVTGLKQKR